MLTLFDSERNSIIVFVDEHLYDFAIAINKHVTLYIQCRREASEVDHGGKGIVSILKYRFIFLVTAWSQYCFFFIFVY